MRATSPVFTALFRRLLVCLFGAAALMVVASLPTTAMADEDFVCPDYVMESFRNEGLASRDRMDASRMSAYAEFVGKCARAADENGRTILHDTIYHKNTGGFGGDVAVSEVVQFLIKNGADVNAKGSLAPWYGYATESSGFTPLHEAAYVGDWESAKLLLANDADVNAGATLKFFTGNWHEHTYNYTPLLDAIRNLKPDMVDLLIDKEADLRATITTKVSRCEIEGRPGKYRHDCREEFTYLEYARDRYNARFMRRQCARIQSGIQDATDAEMLRADRYRRSAAILVLLGDDWECALEAQEQEDLSQKIADSIDVLNAAGAALAMAGNVAGFKRAHPLIDYNQNGGSFGFAWTVSDRYMLVGLDDTIGLTWSNDRWTVKSQLVGGDKLSSSLSAGWEITF